MELNEMYLEGESNCEYESKKTIGELLFQLNKCKSGDHICGIFNNEELTLKRLMNESLKISELMKNEECIGICMDLSLELIIVLCGLIVSGVTYVPLEPNLPDERLSYLIDDSQMKMIIGKEQFNRSLFNQKQILFIEYNQLRNKDEEIEMKEKSEVVEESIYCIMYTSGSTGHPKGVRLTHRSLINRLNWQWKSIPYEENEVCCLKTSISFVDSISEMFGPLLKGIRLIIIPKYLLLDINQLINVFNEHHLTRLIVVPSLLSVLLEYFSMNKIQIESLRYLICSGENLSPNLIESFFQIYPFNCELLNLYGSTEVMADVTYEMFSSSNDLKEKSFDGRTSIGIPIDNMRLDIINPDQDGIGEIYVSGPGVADGYHRTQTFNDKFLPDIHQKGKFTFRTGDMAKIWNQRFILYGRSDYQVKIAGNRVNLNEIELMMKSHWNCREPIALLSNGKIVVFIKENEKCSNLDRNSLSEYLPSYAIPSSFIRIDQFPLLVSGKIDRRALLNLINEETKEEVSSSLLSPFSRVLEQFGIDRSNIDRNFFAAGGSSLNALLIVAKLHCEGFHHLTVERLINAPTLRDIELDICTSNNQTDQYFAEEIEDGNHFHFISLKDVNQENALQILTESFVTHGEIDTLIHQHRQELKQEFSRQWKSLMIFNWNTYRDSNLSFAILDQNFRLIGLALSYDMSHPPPSISLLIDQMTLLSPLNTLIDVPLFQRYDQLITKEHLTRIMRSHVTTVDPNLTPGQRLTTIYLIEKHLLHIAKINSYEAVITANTSSVTQQLAQHVLKYHTNDQTPVHLFTDPSTGKRLFPQAPNHYSVTISVKYISSK